MPWISSPPTFDEVNSMYGFKFEGHMWVGLVQHVIIN